MRPIDADAAIEYIKAKMIPNPREGSRGIVYNAGYELAIRAIEVQPTIDSIKSFHNIGNGEEWVDSVPVEWLIDRANDPERAPLYRRYAQMLYEEWQKEQEAR